MIARAKNINWKTLSRAIVSYIPKSQTYLTIGKEYSIYGYSVYKGIVFLLLIDDLERPKFFPASIFELICNDLPSDWGININLGHDVELVAGPDFLVEDLESYVAMVDGEIDLVSRLWEYIGGSGHPL